MAFRPRIVEIVERLIADLVAQADGDTVDLLAHFARHPPMDVIMPDTVGIPSRPAGPGVDQSDPEHGTGTLELVGDERAAVIDVDPLGHSAGRQPAPQRGFEPQHVFGPTPPVPHDQPGVVVEEREQQRLAAGDGRAVQHVTDPQVVDACGLEPAERSLSSPLCENAIGVVC